MADRDTELQRLLDDERAKSEELVGQLLARTRDLELRAQEAASLAAARDEAQSELRRVEQSVLWHLIEVGRKRLYGALGGSQSVAGRAVSAGVRLFGRAVLKWQSPMPAPVIGFAWEPVVFPVLPHPQASIVIPVHTGAELTARCLRAILASAGNASYEVILVDDRADQESKRLLRSVSGARVMVNREHQGFLRSVNRGAATARGRHVVVLNSDTEPQPGWLDALVDRVESASDIGVVAPKLIFPGGLLQEAGGIVWSDGTTWGYGRRHDTAAPEYNYAREIDYGSAAALLVRGEMWRDLGGFDERFAPVYWEDADLCFAARSKGWRVIYEPAAAVIHDEGVSTAVDTERGERRHQESNRPRFEEKWRELLSEQPARPSADRAYEAANHRTGQVVLVIDHRVPTPDRDSGSLRMWHLLEGLQRLGCHVVFIADDLAPIEPYTSRLREAGVEVVVGTVSIQQRLEQLGGLIELAILSRPYVAPRYLHLIRGVAPHARVVYDTVDLHFVREGRRSRALGNGTSGLARTFRELELGIARASDTTLVVTETEREELLRLSPGLAVSVVPNAHLARTDEVPGREQRAGLLFVGGFEHDPNVDAVLYLVDEIMPFVWGELGDVPLAIVGPHAPEEIRVLAGPNVEVAGWVEEIEPRIDSAVVSVAPLRYGAGMKGKVTQSLAAGLPVVTSTVGAEGLGAREGEELLVGDEAELFARRVIEVYRDDDLWSRLSFGGQALASRIASPDLQVEVLRQLLGSPTVPVGR